MAGTDSTETTTQRPRKRRIWRILIALGGIGILLILVAPLIAAPIVKGMVEDAIEDQLAVDATIDDLSLSLTGSVTLSGLRLVDESGRDVADLERAHASVALLQALGGTYAFGAAVDGLTVRVYEESDGGWSASRLPREREEKAEDDEPKDPASFDLRGLAELKNTSFVLVRADGTTVRVMLDGAAEFAGPNAAASIRGAAEVIASGAAPGTQAGRVTWNVALPGDPGTWADVASLTADAALDFERPIDLAPLAPVLGAALPVELRAGTLGGRGEVRLAPGMDVAMTAGFTVDGVELRGPRPDADLLVIEQIRLDASTTSGEGGALTPKITLAIGDALRAEVNGVLSGAGTPNARLAGELSIDGDVNDLANLAKGWVELRDGVLFEGAVFGGGPFEVSLTDYAVDSASAQLAVGIADLVVLDRTQGPVDIGTLNEPRLACSVAYDAGAAMLRVPSFSVEVGPVQASGATALAGIGTKPTLGPTNAELEADLDALVDALSGVVVFGDRTLAGTVSARLDAEETDGVLPLTARLEARGLRVGGIGALDALAEEPGAPVNFGDITASMRGSFGRATDAVAIEEFTLIGQGMDARGSAQVTGVSRLTTLDELPDVDVNLVATADPSELPAWVHRALGDKEIAGMDCALRVEGGVIGDNVDVKVDITGRDVALVLPETLTLRAGSLRTSLDISGPREALVIRGDGEALTLAFATVPGPVEPGETPAEPIVIDEPRALFDIDATLGIERGDLELRKLHLESRTLSGDVEGTVQGLLAGGDTVIDGLRGDLTYVPDHVAAAFGPLIPGRLSGAEAEPCRFELNGRLTEFTAAGVVENLTGTVDVGVGKYEQTGLSLGGDAHVEVKDGQANLTSKLAANGGEMTIDGGIIVTPQDGRLVMRDSSLAVDAQRVAANTGLGPLLGFVHPAFGAIDNLNQTEIGGFITCELDLRYDGELDADTLAGGWAALPKEPIQGSVTFALDAASLVGSPLFQELLSHLGGDGVKDFDLKPITLNVIDGRVHYANPWEWTVRGAKTTFGGSIGLDHSLDLTWSIPITEEVAAANKHLDRLVGQTIDIPLGGTITRPKLMTDGLLTNLATDVVKTELKEALDSLTGQAGGDANAKDPASLLKRADDLWKAGDKAEAAKLYQEIRSKHKVSLVYALNRDKIKERAAWKP